MAKRLRCPYAEIDTSNLMLPDDFKNLGFTEPAPK